ncbi:MAG: alpha/beta hydrolase [Candidatus Abyssubacteria bacterium]
MSFCVINGVRIFYECEGEGPPLVLVHGAGQDTVSWRYNVPHFARSHRVIALDLPGHGKSGMVLPHISATDDFVRFVWGVIDALNLERPVLAGHSMGSGICLAVALEHGPRLGGVVAVDGADKVVGVFGEEIHEAYINSPLDLMMEMSMESFRALCSTSTPQERIEEIAQDLLRIHPRVTASDTRAFNSFNISERSGDICVPVLFISGAEDFLVTPTMVRETASRFPNSQVVILDGVGHFPHTEAPERFNREVSEWLARVQKGARYST